MDQHEIGVEIEGGKEGHLYYCPDGRVVESITLESHDRT